MFQQLTQLSAFALLVSLLAGCGDKKSAEAPLPSKDTTVDDASAQVATAETEIVGASETTIKKPSDTGAEVDRASIQWTEKLLQAEMKYHNPAYNGQGQFQIEDGKPVVGVLAGTGIVNLNGLEGLPFRQLDLSDTEITDLSPLAGMPLEALYLERTLVADLTPLRGAQITDLALSETPVHTLLGLEGMPLEELRMVKTNVADLSPLKGAPLKSLWCTGSPLTNIAALKGAPLVSLTLHRTKVLDLSPLAGSQLKRLHIAETPVMDLTPLRDLPLTRLVFTPPRIRAGLENIRAISTMQEIGTRFDTPEEKDLVPPARFWQAMEAMKARAASAGARPPANTRRPPPIIIPFRPGVLPKPPAPPNFKPNNAPPSAPPTGAPPVQ